MENNIKEEKEVENNKKKEDLKPKEPEKGLEECQKLAKEYLAGWQRARADFLNYKKEETERIRDFFRYSNGELILKILPILDNFEKAEKEIPDDKKNDKFLAGVLQIKKQLQDFLKNQGVEAIKSIGEKFDLNFHEVVEEVEINDNNKETGTIIEEVQKGYLLNNEVIRPAKVRVLK